MPRKPVHYVTDPAVWKILVAPVRAEILETLRMLGPCGIADVARQLDRPADSLYRHFEKIIATGVVVETGTRRAGRRTERIYDMIADDLAPRFGKAGGQAVNDAYLVTATTILTMSVRTFRAAAAAGQLVGLGLDKPCNTRAFFEHVWLTPADFDELNAIFSSLADFLERKKTRTAATRLQLVTVLVAPIVRRRGAARSRATTRSRGVRPPARSSPTPSSSRKRVP
ncbi:MAG: ArsR family transcriptional regulator [Planctomycetia bacterium]|nr:ArsR family transcriptional regulator [Planctomycetia bacterium]